MNVRKFTASTSRGAWSLVREALGPDAVILSNRAVADGVEILALAGEDMASLAEPFVEKTISETTLASLSPNYKPAQSEPLAISAPVPAVALPQSALGEINAAELHDVMKEIRSMRGMLEMQLAELAWTDQHKREPAKSSVLREMLAAGFSASLSRYLIERMPAGASKDSGMEWIKTILTRNLATIDNENEILEKGGVYALVGPTGVGKTTTTAKLAARCVMRHGPGKLALITTDGYRIGGYEQLRIYGKILGVMVHSVKDEADLRIALDELKGKHTVLIDTVGVSQRDQMVAEQIAMLTGAGSQVKRLLCLNATSTGETLNEVVRSYMGNGLAGCILTKLDEAATIGSALDVVIRQKLNLYYVANGQRVPEDLHVANQQYLVDRAFKLKRETAPFQFNDAEIPLVMANTARAMNDKSLREVILG
ncbi:flagellar biosynthesis protein FlhF [Herminiimonas fonticola]|uniref:Flagellar biosynthesis protein FlhF n=1 Tax=Herminiimonas fonticola TaxID=303380 RepID=A0A4R6G6N1_9BURK|nr:flagellar biosynthesis protein FlhF [Herminiimonas fonticola]RBA24158.1 FlhF: flagellar biosynthesis protein FlhF [Herminiimonas fonticola]TDN90157.1 flagellar biosynthesis protein FlhF [Herminiimonas fonticola]